MDDIGAGDRHNVVVAGTDGDGAAPHAVFTAAVGTHIHIVHHAHGEAGKHIGGVAIHGDNVLRGGVGVETGRAVGELEGVSARSIDPRHPCCVAANRVGIKADGCNTFRQIDAVGVQLVASILDTAVRGEADGQGTRFGDERSDVHSRARRRAAAVEELVARRADTLENGEVVAATLTHVGAPQADRTVGRGREDDKRIIGTGGIVAIGTAVVEDCDTAGAERVDALGHDVCARHDSAERGPCAVVAAAAVGANINGIERVAAQVVDGVGGVIHIDADCVVVGREAGGTVGNLVRHGIAYPVPAHSHPVGAAAHDGAARRGGAGGRSGDVDGNRQARVAGIAQRAHRKVVCGVGGQPVESIECVGSNIRRAAVRHLPHRLRAAGMPAEGHLVGHYIR